MEDKYYENEDAWGDYQNVSLEEIVNNFIMSQVGDSFVKTVKRYQVLFQAKRAIRELYYDVVREIRAIELELSPRLTVTVPPDFVSFVRVSIVDEKGRLIPLSVNNKISTAEVYLQDHNYELLFDYEGNVLKSDNISKDAPLNVKSNLRYEYKLDEFGDRTFDEEGNPILTRKLVRENKLDDLGDNILGKEDKKNYVCNRTFFQPNKDMSEVYPKGSYVYNSSTGVLQFSSEVFTQNVVIEYISDGLYSGHKNPESKIHIHKFAESAVYNFIYYELTKMSRHVPMNEKMRARKEYYNSRRIAKRRINSFSVADIMQVFKGVNKWVKK